MPRPDTGISRLSRDIAAAAARGDGLSYTAVEVQEIAAEIERNAAAGLSDAADRFARSRAMRLKF